MDERYERLKGAAQSGNIDTLYALIRDDAYILESIDQIPFFHTPLHIAAATGKTDFAMEIMNLKPSLAKKLNQEGFSPIDLALQNQQNELVVDLVSIDKDLVRVKGREGYTPLHVVAKDGNVPLLSQFLSDCPDCLFDLTIRKETALHVAAQNNQLGAIQAILVGWLSTPRILQSEKARILNLQDKEGNTVLHIAASKNQPHQMIKLLIECKGVDRKIINGRGFTALDVLQRQTDQVDSAGVKILRSYSWSFEPSRFNEKLTRDIMSMKPETANAVLVVLALVLTMTYQALLSPPGSVFQGDAGPASDPTTNKVGKSVINPASFLLFYIPNGIAFLMAWIVTILLLQVVAESIFRLVYPLYIVMCFCYGSALGIIQPSDLPTWFAYVPSLFVILVYYPALYRFRKR